MSNIAIIPARGGSKRIPRKNIKLFLGKPIIAYSIETALRSGLYEEVMVSTEDKEIAQIAKSYGASVPFLRTNINANDYATTSDVLNEVLLTYENKGKKFDYCTCIYPTAPFVRDTLLKESFSKLIDKNFDCVFSVQKYDFPIQRAMRKNNLGGIELINENNKNKRSQDLISTFHDAGQFYSFSVKKFIENQSLWTDNTSFIELNALEAQDIDTEMDWKIAELKYKLLNEIS